MATRPLRSPVWRFYRKRDDGESSECLLCKVVIVSKGGSTSSMTKHMAHCHTLEWKNATANPSEQGREKKLKVKGAMDQYLRAKPCSSWRSGALTQAIVDMIALDLRPINIVNGIGFQRLLRVAEPSYVVPSATQVTSLLQKKWDKGQRHLRDGSHN